MFEVKIFVDAILLIRNISKEEIDVAIRFVLLSVKICKPFSGDLA